MGAVDRAFDLDRPAETVTAGDRSRSAGSDGPIVLREPGEDYPEYCQRLVADWDRNLRFDAPREELARFEPERAGLIAVSPAEARRYIAEYRIDRVMCSARLLEQGSRGALAF